MSRRSILVIVLVLAVGLIGTTAFASAQGPRPRPEAWVDGERFAGVVTPATFKPGSGSFDELYAGCEGGFKDGVPLISDAGPGDTDYNGGRWHLNVITDSEDCAKYTDADSDADLDKDDFTSTDTYFECPLLPRRGK